MPYVYPGRMYDWDGTPLWLKYEKDIGASRHMSNVFNIYVVMQIFNMLNARKLNNEKNIFNGLFGNYFFIAIWFIIVAG